LEASLAVGADAPAEHRARALLVLGEFANDLGDLERGTTALQESLALYRVLGDRLGTGFALDMLGCAAEDHGDYAQANRECGSELCPWYQRIRLDSRYLRSDRWGSLSIRASIGELIVQLFLFLARDRAITF
jgi:hypothetical protein